MTLIQVIEKTVEQGREITFKKILGKLEIIIEELGADTDVSILPMDHFTEDTIVDCITFQNKRLDAKS